LWLQEGIGTLLHVSRREIFFFVFFATIAFQRRDIPSSLMHLGIITLRFVPAGRYNGFWNHVDDLDLSVLFVSRMGGHDEITTT